MAKQYISKDALRDALGRCRCMNDVWEFFFADRFEDVVTVSELENLIIEKRHTVYSEKQLPYDVVTVGDIREVIYGDYIRR